MKQFVISSVLLSLTFSSFSEPRQTDIPSITVTETRLDNYTATHADAGVLGNMEILDIPFSISAYTAELIEHEHARTLHDVLKHHPSTQDAAIGDNFDHVTIRGFDTNTRASFRRDGLSFPGLADFALENVERIEVLQGVSGLLYGFDRPAGVLNHVTKQPVAERLITLNARTQTHDGYYLHLDLGGPTVANDSIRHRVNVAGEKIGDFRHRGDLERWMASAALDWRVSDALTFGVNADFQHKSLAAQGQIPLTTEGRLPEPVDPHVLLGQPWTRYETDIWHTQMWGSYRLTDDWSVEVRAGHANNVRQSIFSDILSLESNGDINSAIVWYSPDQKARITSSRLLLSGTFRTGRIQHKIAAGFSSAHLNARVLGYSFLDLPTDNIYRPVYTDPPLFPEPLPKRRDKSRQTDFFVADTAQLTGHWVLLAGFRYARYASVSYDAVTGLPRNDYQANKVSPAAALMFQPSDNMTFYFSYAEGLEPGSIAPVIVDSPNAGEVLPPLISQQYEAGFKMRLQDNLSVNAAVFRINRPLEYLNDRRVYVQDGLQRHEGVEITAQGELLPTLSLLAGAAWLRPRLLETADSSIVGNSPGGVGSRRASLFLEYTVPQVAGLSFDIGGFYQGRRPFNNANMVDLPAYVRWDAGVSYAMEWRGYSLAWRLRVENLTDKFYWSAAALNVLTTGEPRTISLSLQFEL